MSTYVISDIHGCYREFMQLLQYVKFDVKVDELYILGDIIDRGPGSEQMFDWVYEHRNGNVHMCMGNHESLFIDFMDFYECGEKAKKIMKHHKIEELDISSILTSDMNNKDKEVLLQYFNFCENHMQESFDKYGTIGQLMENGKGKKYLYKMREFFRGLPYYFKLKVKGKTIYLVHAFISEPPEECDKFDMIWSRAYPNGEPGIPGKIIIYGHTPTVNHYYAYEGNVKIKKIDGSITINIDCGCYLRTNNTKLALLRLDDFKVFYSNITKHKYVPDI